MRPEPVPLELPAEPDRARRVSPVRRRGFLLHLHPPKVTEAALRPAATLGLGIAAIALFLLLAASGLLLSAFYVPSLEGAYASIQDLQFATRGGAFVRALHRWSAHGLVFVVTAHLLRVVATASYRGRAFNWFVGLGLLGVTLGSAFTGYLLPWDQLSYWAVRVSLGMTDELPLLGDALRALLAASHGIGQETLTRFFWLHAALLPLSMGLLVVLHLWRIRRAGGLAISEDQRATVDASPHLVLREATVGLAVAALLVFAALLWRPGLGPPSEAMPSALEKAPWYFLWIQEAVSYSAPVGAVALPLTIALLLALFPFVDRSGPGSGRWLPSREERGALLAAVVFAVVWLVGAEALLGSSDGSHLFNPASAMLLLAVLATVGARVSTGSWRVAWLAASGVLLVTAVGFLVLGLLRGPGWVLFAGGSLGL